jgi:hypothetical protein
MMLYWLAYDDGRYFISPAPQIFAMMRASFAGLTGKPRDAILLDARAARKVPKGMIGRVLEQSEAEKLFNRISG